MSKQNYLLVNGGEPLTVIVDDPNLESLKLLLPSGKVLVAFDSEVANWINYNYASISVTDNGEPTKDGEKNLEELSDAYKQFSSLKYQKEEAVEEKNKKARQKPQEQKDKEVQRRADTEQGEQDKKEEREAEKARDKKRGK